MDTNEETVGGRIGYLNLNAFFMAAEHLNWQVFIYTDEHTGQKEYYVIFNSTRVILENFEIKKDKYPIQ